MPRANLTPQSTATYQRIRARQIGALFILSICPQKAIIPVNFLELPRYAH